MASIYNRVKLDPGRERPDDRRVDLVIDDHALSLEIQGTKGFVVAVNLVPIVVPLL